MQGQTGKERGRATGSAFEVSGITKSDGEEVVWANGDVSPPDVRGCRVQGVEGAHSAAGSRGENRRLRSGIWTEAGSGSTRNVAGWARAPHPAGARSRVRVQLGTEHAGPPM